jgi:hypothetical protein
MQEWHILNRNLITLKKETEIWDTEIFSVVILLSFALKVIS